VEYRELTPIEAWEILNEKRQPIEGECIRTLVDYNDAVAIACLDNIFSSGLLNFRPLDSLILKKHVPKGDYQQTKGTRSEQKIPTAKIEGFRKFDKVEYLGKEYLIKGRMATGYAILMDIDGNKIDLKPIPKFSIMKRLSARDSWVVFRKAITNF
jgi:hypothetical protein